MYGGGAERRREGARRAASAAAGAPEDPKTPQLYVADVIYDVVLYSINTRLVICTAS